MFAFIGLDPGLSGACVIMTEESYIEAYPFKRLGGEWDMRDFLDWISSKKLEFENDGYEIVHAFIEKVHSMPGQGVASTFKFGFAYGSQRACIEAVKIPYTLVTPQSWTKETHRGIPLHLKPKERSEIAINRLFPSLDLNGKFNKTQMVGIRDAILLAEYGRRSLFK